MNLLFPPSVTVYPACPAAEFEILPQVIDRSQDPCKSVNDLCEMAYKHKYLSCCLLRLSAWQKMGGLSVNEDHQQLFAVNYIR